MVEGIILLSRLQEGDWVLYPPLSEPEVAPNLWLQHIYWLLGHPEAYVAILKVAVFIGLAIWLTRRLWKGGSKTLALTIGAMFAAFMTLAAVSFQRVQAIFMRGAGPDDLSSWPVYFLQGFGIVTTLSFAAFGGYLAYKVWYHRKKLFADLVANLFLSTFLCVCLGYVYVSLLDSSIGIDKMLHDTYYIVAHGYYVAQIGLHLIGFAVFYRCFELIFAASYNLKLGLSHWFVYSLGVALSYGVQIWVFNPSMPRRYIDFDASRMDLANQLSALAVIVTLISWLIFAICVFEAIYRRIKNGKDPRPGHDRPDSHF